MLNAIRQGTRSWAMKLILGLLVVAFAIWGVGDIFRSGTGQAVATIGDREITVNEFAAEFQREIAFQSQGREQPLTREQALQQGLDRQVLDRLVFQEVVAQAARDAGLRMPDSIVFADIRNMPAFQSELGFDRFAFQNFLRQSGLSEAQFMDMMRGDAARRQLVNALMGPVSVPDAMADAFYRYQEERRTARYIEIPAAEMDVSAPAEEDLRAFYKSNSEMFQAPEYRTFTVLRLSPEDLMDEVAVAEEDVRQYYEQNQARYAQPARRHVQQIVVPDEDQAQSLVKRIRGGAVFTAIAKELDRTVEDIDLGTMTRDELAGVDPALAEAAFALDEPGVTEPVETDFGWHIVRVTEIQEDRTQSFEQVRPEIRKELLRDRAIDAVFDLGVRVEDALAGGAPVSEVAEQFGLPVTEYGPLDMSGLNPQDEVPEPAPGQAVLDTAFETQPGAYLELNETEGGGYYVVQVDEVTPSRTKPFEMVEAEARQAYLQRERREAARARAEELQKTVAGGASLESVVTELDFAEAVQTASNVGRNGQNAPSAFGRETLNALFSAAEGRVIAAPGVGGDTHLVMEVAKISDANPGANPSGTQAIASALEEVVANDILAQFRLALYEEYDVRLYPDVAAEALQPGTLSQF